MLEGVDFSFPSLLGKVSRVVGKEKTKGWEGGMVGKITITPYMHFHHMNFQTREGVKMIKS